jgi:MAX-like protein X
MLPATGAPVSRQRASKMREMFDEYVRIRTLDNWKFWIVSFTSLQIRSGGQQYV